MIETTAMERTARAVKVEHLRTKGDRAHALLKHKSPGAYSQAQSRAIECTNKAQSRAIEFTHKAQSRAIECTHKVQSRAIECTHKAQSSATGCHRAHMTERLKTSSQRHTSQTRPEMMTIPTPKPSSSQVISLHVFSPLESGSWYQLRSPKKSQKST